MPKTYPRAVTTIDFEEEKRLWRSAIYRNRQLCAMEKLAMIAMLDECEENIYARSNELVCLKSHVQIASAMYADCPTVARARRLLLQEGVLKELEVPLKRPNPNLRIFNRSFLASDMKALSKP
jgi:hypothetical protein